MKTEKNIKDEKHIIKNYMKFSILNLSIFGFTHIKDVRILEEMKNCLRDAKDPS